MVESVDAQLRAHIEKLERRQVERRQHLADVERVIAVKDLEIANLKARLPEGGRDATG